MALFNKKSNGIMDVIRCDEPSYLIWKWRPKGADLDSQRANSIRWGSSLRVKDGSVAVLVYPSEDGYAQEYIEGPFDAILETKNLPILTGLLGALYNGSSPFQAEIYFINLAQIIQIQFGVPYFDVFDPRFLDFGVPTAVRGTISFQITDYQEFIRLHRLDHFDLDTFQKQVRDVVIRTVKSAVASAPSTHNIPVVQIESKISDINFSVEEELKERLARNFGVTISCVDISVIELDKTSEGYRQLKAVTSDVSTAKVQAQTAVDIKKMGDMQRIEAENLEQTLKMQREETQYAQHMQTQTAHLTTHQLNQQAATGIAGAEALGKMGTAGATDITGGGMNPTAMFAGMAMGGVIGKQMAGTMGEMMAGVNLPVNSAPPPIPTIAYYVAVNGQQSGPYDMASLAQMAANGGLKKDSLVWKTGMAGWVPAMEVQELASLFLNTPPEIPQV